MRLSTQTIFLSIIFIFLISPFTFSQTQIPNGGFENWTNLGSNDEESANWNSNKTGGGFASLGPQTCFREDTDVFAGSYVLYLRTRTAFGAKVNGTVTTGKIEAPSLDPLDGYIQTKRNDTEFNSPFTGRPDSLVGYFKYNSESGDDGSIAVILHGDYDVESPDQGGSAPFMIGTATYITPTSDVNTWTRFSVPFTYTSPDVPSYMLAVVTSSSTAGAGVQGSEIWVDELEVIYCTSSDSVMISACDTYTSPSGNYVWETSGVYYDTLLNAGMCDSFVMVNLTVDTLEATASQNGNTLSAEVESAEYQWLDCNNENAIIEGQTNQSFSPSENGSYAVAITKGACIDTSDCFTIDAVGIENDYLKNIITLYPNPGKEQINIHAEEVLQKVGVKVYSSNGQLLQEKTASMTSELTINASELSAGIYFVRLSTNENSTVFKWVKE